MVLKKSIGKIGLIVLLVLLAGCSNIFRHNIEKPGNYKEKYNSAITDTFRLDNNSDLFIRKLYVQENKDIPENKGKPKFELTDNSKANKETPKDSVNSLIEIQYLFFNGDKVLYISPIPSEYIRDKGAYFLKADGTINYPNCYFFNTFYFGKVIGNTASDSNVVFEFENKKIAQKWNVSLVRDKDNIIRSYTVNSIDEYKAVEGGEPLFLNTLTLNKAMKNKMTFKNEHRFPKKGTTTSKNYFHFLSFREPRPKNATKKQAVQQSESDSNDDDKEEVSVEKPDSTEQKPDYKERNARRFTGNTLYIFYTDKNKDKVEKLVIPFEKKATGERKDILFKSGKVEFINGLKP